MSTSLYCRSKSKSWVGFLGTRQLIWNCWQKCQLPARRPWALDLKFEALKKAVTSQEVVNCPSFLHTQAAKQKAESKSQVLNQTQIQNDQDKQTKTNLI